jgi:hypothetical protein
MPYHVGASEARVIVESTIVGWAARLAEVNKHLTPPSMTVEAAAAWMARLPALIALLPEAGYLVDEVCYATAYAVKAIDRAPDRVYVGPCECGTTLYAIGDRDVVRCPDCAMAWEVAERRRWMMGYVSEQVLTAAEISRALPSWLGIAVTPARIRGYAHRGKLTVRAWRHERAAYRVGDVLDLVTTPEDHAAG